MSGGAITDNQYDLERMCDWSRNIRKEMLETRWTHWSPEMHREAEWIARVTDDLYACLYALDRTLSGDSGEERGLNAIREFRDTWFTGISRGDLAGLGKMFDNILGTVAGYSARMKTVSEAADAVPCIRCSHCGEAVEHPDQGHISGHAVGHEHPDYYCDCCNDHVRKELGRRAPDTEHRETPSETPSCQEEKE